MWSSITRVLRVGALVALYAAMLVCVIALWNPQAPEFIYVAF